MDQGPQFLVLAANLDYVKKIQSVSGVELPDGGWDALGAALGASPAWHDIPRAIFVIRQTPRPLLAVIGYLDAAARARLDALRWQLDHVLPSLQYVSYAQAEEDCERLAAELISRFGRKELLGFRYVALPRGGLVVLGILAYVLDLPHSQLDPPHPRDVPVVAVDDCALTGSRFGRFLSNCESRRVIFAHLRSHPDLRAAIQAREPRVLACVSARDLRDHAPAHLGEDYEAWRERWLARSGNSCYWVGQPDHVCFPWSEPDIGIWNPVTEREERGWRLVPPQFCIKNRQSHASKPVRVQMQPEGTGPLKPSDDVLFGELEGKLIVANVKTGATVGLTDVAADMWRAIVAGGQLDEVSATLRQTYEVNESTLRGDLDRFVDELLAQDFLRRNGA